MAGHTIKQQKHIAVQAQAVEGPDVMESALAAAVSERLGPIRSASGSAIGTSCSAARQCARSPRARSLFPRVDPESLHHQPAGSRRGGSWPPMQLSIRIRDEARAAAGRCGSAVTGSPEPDSEPSSSNDRHNSPTGQSQSSASFPRPSRDVHPFWSRCSLPPTDRPQPPRRHAGQYHR